MKTDRAQEALMRNTFGGMARIEDEALSQSSDDEKGQFDHLDEIARLAVGHNDFSISVGGDNRLQKDEQALQELLGLSDDDSDDGDSEQMLTNHN